MTDPDAYLDALKRGRPAAIERLVDEYEGPLYRYFLARHGDPCLAGEQSADAFAELARALPKMRGGPEQLRPFVYAVARNVERRSWRWRPTGDTTLDQVAAASSRNPCPAESADQDEQLQHALEAINQLDETTRQIFLLRFVEGLSTRETADTLGLSISVIKSRLHRGRQELRAMLATSEGEP